MDWFSLVLKSSIIVYFGFGLMIGIVGLLKLCCQFNNGYRNKKDIFKLVMLMLASIAIIYLILKA